MFESARISRARLKLVEVIGEMHSVRTDNLTEDQWEQYEEATAALIKANKHMMKMEDKG